VQARVSWMQAWAFWTDVSHWTLDRSVEWVRLDGPFAAGTNGLTKPRDAEPIRWRIQDATPGRATIEIELPGAVVRFEWRMVAAGEETRITQSVTLSGARAEDYVALAESQLKSGIPEGMRTLAEAMEKA
jgi:hypothetical protein